MKTRFKKMLSLALTLVLAVSLFPVAALPAGAATTYAVGDIIEYGSYPQSRVTNADLIAALNAADKVWTSYRYYSGTGQRDGQMQPGNWMRFADLYLNGEKYRAVVFDEYRPALTHLSLGVSDIYGPYQPVNGYETGTVYYFKYEPLQWRVLDPSAGLILCEYAIDAQPFQNLSFLNYDDALPGEPYSNYQTTACELYASDYPTSSIRVWLNEDFYNVAFTDAQKENIPVTLLPNDACSIPAYDSASTEDRVFLLSGSEAQNAAYGLNGKQSRITVGTDYAKCQGNEVKSGKSEWFLRSPTLYGNFMAMIRPNGDYNLGCASCWASAGVRPAVVLSSLTSDAAVAPSLYSHVKNGHTVREAVKENETFTGCTSESSYESVVYCSCGAELSRQTVTVPAIGQHTWDNGEIVKAATCSEKGDTKYTCTVPGCGATETRTDVQENPDNHADYGTEVVNDSAATCYADGYTGDTVCARCRAVLTPGETISKDTVPHAWDNGTVTLKPTCSATGVMLYRCTVKSCGASKEEEIKKDPDAHVFGAPVVVPPTCTDGGYTSHNCTLCRYGYNDSEQPALGHDWNAPVWKWNGGNASATFTCKNGDHPRTVTATVTVETAKEPTETEKGKNVYTATVEFEGETYTDTVEKTVPALNDGLCKWCGKDHSVSFWQRIVGFFHNILYFFAHLFGRR